MVEVGWDRRMSMRDGADSVGRVHSARMPVPESRIARLPSSGEPRRTTCSRRCAPVSGPGDASEPREPQNWRARQLPCACSQKTASPTSSRSARTAEAGRLEVADLAVDASMRRWPWLGMPSRNALASGRSRIGTGSPDSSTGLNVFASSARLICASA